MAQLVHTVPVAAPALLRGAAAQSHRCHRAPPPFRLDRPLRRCVSVLACRPHTAMQPCADELLAASPVSEAQCFCITMSGGISSLVPSPCNCSLLHDTVNMRCLQGWCSSTFQTARHWPFRERASCSSPCCCSSCCPSAMSPSTAGTASSSWPTASAAPTPPQPTSQPTCLQASSLEILHSVLPQLIQTAAPLPDGLQCDFTLDNCLIEGAKLIGAGCASIALHQRHLSLL